MNPPLCDRALCFLAYVSAAVFFSASAASAVEPIRGAARNQQVGICTHFAFEGNDWDPDQIVPLLVASGAGWVRDDMNWSGIEKAKGVYEIPEKTMRWINAVSAAGIKIDIIFNYSNKLYAPDIYNPEAYSKAAAFVAKQLAGKVQAIEILNEPANFGFTKCYGGVWNGIDKDGKVQPWVGKYVELINHAAKVIKAANPNVKVIGLGSVAPVNFRQLAMGIAPQVDGIVDHPYSPRTVAELIPFASSEGIMKRDGIATADKQGSFASQMRMYFQQSAKYNGPKEIWLTEFGWATYQESKAGGQFAGFTESAQAKYILRRLTEAFGLGVTAAFIYDLRDDGTDPGYMEHHYGLLNRQSQPKPSFVAVQRFNAFMAPYRPKKSFEVNAFPVDSRPDTYPIVWDGSKLKTSGSVRTYQFANEKGQAMVAVWSTERADGDLSPLLGDLEIETNAAVTSVSAYNPLTDQTAPVPFQKEEGRILLKRVTIPDSPVFFTLN